MKILIALIVASLTSLANAATTNLIVNGSFETTPSAVNNGQWKVFNSILGWTTTSGAGIEVRNNVVGSAQDGENFVELDSHNFSYNSAQNNDPNNLAVITNSAMAQSVQTLSNQSYLLSFYYSPRINQPKSTNGISVFWNNALITDISLQGSNKNIWTLFSFVVQGTGGLDQLKFSATGLDDSLGGNIDNVALNAVPVPAAAWLFGSALGLLGFARRKA